MANRLPLHERHAAAGAKFENVADWELPVTYGDPAAEYALVRRSVGLLDRGHVGMLELTGRDRAAFLHALESNEVKALGPGQGCAATCSTCTARCRSSSTSGSPTTGSLS